MGDKAAAAAKSEIMKGGSQKLKETSLGDKAAGAAAANFRNQEPIH